MVLFPPKLEVLGWEKVPCSAKGPDQSIAIMSKLGLVVTVLAVGGSSGHHVFSCESGQWFDGLVVWWFGDWFPVASPKISMKYVGKGPQRGEIGP